eukprot:TRINITY_DN4297_c0_g1_i1.p1 TRINITY_DN4297_c0_g1~~TRINITY_DN4297_c0_g1_i1.p1  ORF type:complete len:1022 (+),score=153.72 TRINITY_DN4297_c0_g1_i1:82-3147(+)
MQLGKKKAGASSPDSPTAPLVPGQGEVQREEDDWGFEDFTEKGVPSSPFNTPEYQQTHQIPSTLPVTKKPTVPPAVSQQLQESVQEIQQFLQFMAPYMRYWKQVAICLSALLLIILMYNVTIPARRFKFEHEHAVQKKSPVSDVPDTHQPETNDMQKFKESLSQLGDLMNQKSQTYEYLGNQQHADDVSMDARFAFQGGADELENAHANVDEDQTVDGTLDESKSVQTDPWVQRGHEGVLSQKSEKQKEIESEAQIDHLLPQHKQADADELIVSDEHHQKLDVKTPDEKIHLQFRQRNKTQEMQKEDLRSQMMKGKSDDYSAHDQEGQVSSQYSQKDLGVLTGRIQYNVDTKEQPLQGQLSHENPLVGGSGRDTGYEPKFGSQDSSDLAVQQHQFQSQKQDQYEQQYADKGQIQLKTGQYPRTSSQNEAAVTGGQLNLDNRQRPQEGNVKSVQGATQFSQGLPASGKLFREDTQQQQDTQTGQILQGGKYPKEQVSESDEGDNLAGVTKGQRYDVRQGQGQGLGEAQNIFPQERPLVVQDQFQAYNDYMQGVTSVRKDADQDSTQIREPQLQGQGAVGDADTAQYQGQFITSQLQGDEQQDKSTQVISDEELSFSDVKQALNMQNVDNSETQIDRTQGSRSQGGFTSDDSVANQDHYKVADTFNALPRYAGQQVSLEMLKQNQTVAKQVGLTGNQDSFDGEDGTSTLSQRSYANNLAANQKAQMQTTYSDEYFKEGGNAQGDIISSISGSQKAQYAQGDSLQSTTQRLHPQTQTQTKQQQKEGYRQVDEDEYHNYQENSISKYQKGNNNYAQATVNNKEVQQEMYVREPQEGRKRDGQQQQVHEFEHGLVQLPQLNQHEYVNQKQDASYDIGAADQRSQQDRGSQLEATVRWQQQDDQEYGQQSQGHGQGGNIRGDSFSRQQYVSDDQQQSNKAGSVSGRKYVQEYDQKGGTANGYVQSQTSDQDEVQIFPDQKTFSDQQVQAQDDDKVQSSREKEQGHVYADEIVQHNVFQNNNEGISET